MGMVKLGLFKAAILGNGTGQFCFSKGSRGAVLCRELKVTTPYSVPEMALMVEVWRGV
jgi:hypothetical protein